MTARVHASLSSSHDPPHPRSQETLDCYSDTAGYPTLPRPRVILPIPRPDSPWSAHEASKLQTVSLRVANGQSRRPRTAESSTPVNSPTHSPAIVRSGSVGEQDTVSRKQQCQCRVAESQCGACRKEAKHLKPIQTTLATISNCNLQRACCSPPIADSDRLTRSLSASTELELSSSRTTRAVDATNMSSQSKAAKKTSGKRPARALSFSFGSSSSAERKRRTLNLFGTMRRRQAADDTHTAEPKGVQAVSTPVAPASPILMGKRSRTVPSSMKVTSNLQQQSIREERDSVSSLETEPWCSREAVEEISGRNHFSSRGDVNDEQANSCVTVPPVAMSKPLPLNVGTAPSQSDVPLESRRHRMLDLSSADASSMRESVESLPRGGTTDSPPPPSTPPSGSYCQKLSPGSHRALSRQPSSSSSSNSSSPVPPPRSASPKLRKHSDPGNESPLLQRAMVGGEQEGSSSPPTERSPRTGRILKKGHTFCVRGSREEPNWVSNAGRWLERLWLPLLW